MKIKVAKSKNENCADGVMICVICGHIFKGLDWEVSETTGEGDWWTVRCSN